MREFTINKNDAGQRLDKFVQKTVKGIPVSLMYKAIRLKKIKVNRKRAEQKQMLLEGDTVQMFLSEDLFEDKISSNELLSVRAEINIVYEDENILICNKPAGVLVHSGDGDGKTSGEGSADDRNTLIYHIQAYLAQKGEYNPAMENSFAPALCNRLDRNTAGMVISAKNAEALRVVNERIKSNQIRKQYLCAVHGSLPKKNDTLSDFLIKDSKTNTVKVLKEKRAGAKEIITKYALVEYNQRSNLSLVEIELVTGRTHQIRAHMSSIGSPLLGDGKYGSIEKDKRLGYKHQALCAYKLTFLEAEDALSYLNGKSFFVCAEDIYFLREFSSRAREIVNNKIFP
ncbi:MAG: RluA family pseudouridine synthase [Clostridia bacterium]|nr:RluA family pseudouridine synthase [Clostridia bacterium]